MLTTGGIWSRFASSDNTRAKQAPVSFWLACRLVAIAKLINSSGKMVGFEIKEYISHLHFDKHVEKTIDKLQKHKFN